MMMKVLLSLLLLVAVPTHAQTSVADFISSDPELSILADALANIVPSEALLDILTSNDLTLFAPTNAAFDALQTDTTGVRVFGDDGFAAHLENLIAFHVAAGKDALNGASIPMANGETVTVNGMTLSSTYNDATVINTQVAATNGVIHKLDAVLLPAFWKVNVVELARSNTLGSLSTLTSFFDVLESGPIGGVVISVAENSLVTMLAPIDEAFEELGPGAVEYAKNNMNFMLNVLQNHVVSGTVLPSSSFEDGDTVTTLRGVLDVEVVEVFDDVSVLIGESLVLETDILVRWFAPYGWLSHMYKANNGIIHTIQNVILNDDDRATLATIFPPETSAPIVAATNAPVVSPADGLDGPPGMTEGDSTPGTDGPPGTDGTDGPPGTDDTDGLPGTDTDGPPGTDGTDGPPGTDGKDGQPGTDGKDGQPGTDGTDGQPGTDGPPGTDDMPVDSTNTTMPVATAPTDMPAMAGTGMPVVAAPTDAPAVPTIDETKAESSAFTVSMIGSLLLVLLTL